MGLQRVAENECAQEMDTLKLQLNEHYLAAAQERRHNEMRTQHLQVEHKLKLQTELERTVELERVQLKTDHEQAVQSIKEDHQQQLLRETGEKERAWAAYNMMRKVRACCAAWVALHIALRFGRHNVE